MPFLGRLFADAQFECRFRGRQLLEMPQGQHVAIDRVHLLEGQVQSILELRANRRLAGTGKPTQELRRQRRIDAREGTLDAPDPHGEDGPRDDDVPDSGALDPALIVEIEESRAEFWQALRDCLGNARREYILITNMILGFNASEIARHVKATVQVVYNEKNRAVEHIRQHCAQRLARLLGELKALRAGSAGRA